MKKVLVFLVLLVSSTFFSVSVFADNQFQQYIKSGDNISVSLTNGIYNVSLKPGQSVKFKWTINNYQGTYISFDGVSSVYSGSSDSQVFSTATCDLSSTSTGWASFINQSDSTLSDLDLSVSVNFSLYNSSSDYAQARVNLTITDIQYFDTSFVSNADLNTKLNQILSSLGSSVGGHDFLGPDAIYFDNRFFDVIYGNGTRTFNSDGLISVTGSTDIRPCVENGNRLPGVYFSPGDYVFVLGYPGDDITNSCSIVLPYTPDVSITEVYSGVSQGNDVSVVWRVFQLSFDQYYSSPYIQILFDSPISGVFYGGYSSLSLDSTAGQAINPNQDQMVDDVDKAGEDQSAQEEQMWSNINTYKGSLDFSLSGWDDASSGLSYVRDVFMIIWDNSPTEIITLSLMLGIAMLSIGRGVGAAVRASSRRRGDD